MGYTGWDDSSYTSYSSAKKSSGATTSGTIFTASTSKADDSLNPAKFTVRESRDSDANPKSTPLILGSDVTGSMGSLAAQIILKDLGVVMKEIYDREPITNPHIMYAAIGDTEWDRYPIQATQFESSIVITDQMEKIYIEGGGGGNRGESYIAAWYLAAFKTECDSFIKRNKKGYLFTIGDEPPLLNISKEAIIKFFGDNAQTGMTAEQLLDEVKKNWHVFHFIVKPIDGAVDKWKNLLGQNAIYVTDVSKLGEIIVSTIQVMEGEDAASVASSWSGDTSLVVASAIKDLVPSKEDTGGLVAL